MADILKVTKRESRGKRNARRMRSGGAVPAILYGHGEVNVALTVPTEQMAAVVRHGGRVVELQGAVNEKALIRELQWDSYGLEVLHADFARVSEHERVEVKVPIELRGQAPGVKGGGVLKHSLHEVEIECEALSIPDKLELSINELQLHGELKTSDLHLLPGMTLLTDPEAIIVQCVEPIAEEEEAVAAEPAAGEPEVIGRKLEEEPEE